jgi:hypothetical protein
VVRLAVPIGNRVVRVFRLIAVRAHRFEHTIFDDAVWSGLSPTALQGAQALRDCG